MNPDGVSYVDMASETWKSGPSNLLNGYWSPLYPALLSVAFLPSHPDSGREFAVAHLVNFIIFLAALWSFSFFLRAWSGARDEFRGSVEERKKYLVPFGFCTFLWFMTEYVSERYVSPDVCVAATVFLAAGICCRAGVQAPTWKGYVLLGLVLGVGYYAKAVMFPLALIFLALVFLWPPFAMKRSGVLTAGLVFAIAIAPLGLLISKRVGHLSTGESGALAYTWLVDGLTPLQGWTGENSERFGSPEHAPRVIYDKPLTVEFASPLPGTYPLWYEPSYWYAGAKSHFDLRKQLRSLLVQARIYKQMLFEMAPFLSGATALAFLAILNGRPLAVPRSFMPLLLWPMAACAVYGVVYTERRYLGPFLVLLWIVLFSTWMFRVQDMVRTAVIMVVLFAAMLPTLDQFAVAAIEDLRDILRPQPSPYAKVVSELRGLGIRQGDRLAIVGPGFGTIGGPGFESYDIRAAGARIVAEIEDDQGFWRMKPEELEKLEGRLQAIGVRAIVATDAPARGEASNWSDLAPPKSRRLAVLMLDAR